MPPSVLLDTSALCAIAAPDDQFKAQAVPLFYDLVHRQEDLYITSYVLLEASATIHRRLGFGTLKKLIQDVMPVSRVHWIDGTTHQEAWDLLSSRNGAGPSLVDWTTIIVARRLGTLVFTFDSHFEAEGISVIPAKMSDR